MRSRRCSTSVCPASASSSACSPTRKSAPPRCCRARSSASVRGGSSSRSRDRRMPAAWRSRSSSFRSSPTSFVKSRASKSKGASAAPSEPPPGSDGAGGAGARNAVNPTRSLVSEDSYTLRRVARRRGRMMSRPIAFVVLMLAVAFSFGCAGPTGADSRGVRGREAAHPAAAPELQRVNALLADLAEHLKPALVHVRVRRAPGEASREEPDEPQRATGSGFIIEPSGLIVTNAHVVEGAETIQVRLYHRPRFAGNVAGRDARVDLALIKIDGATNLTVLPLGDSNRLRVGEFVLALGHPFGLEQSVSFGIVSRKGAPLVVAAPGFDFIQTDAAINPGNSGGPLVNMAGEGIGVNSMAARNGSVGFAVPAKLGKQILPHIAAEGRGRW